MRTAGHLRAVVALVAGVVGGAAVDSGPRGLYPAEHSNVYDVRSPPYRAKGDAKTLTGGAMASGSAVLSVSTGSFAPTDVGKLVYVVGAGASGAPLSTTIQTFTSATQVTLGAGAETTVTGARVTFGTNDASAIQAAIDAVPADGGTVLVPAGNYLLGTTLTVVGRTNVLLEGDGSPSLMQQSEGSNVLTISSSHGIEVRGARFEGIPGDVSISGNSGVDVTASTRIRIAHNTFTGLRYEAVYVKGSRAVVVADNLVVGVSNGIQFRGCDGLTITGNTLRDPQVPPHTFVIAIFLDSTDGHSYGINRNVTISENVVTGYTNSQAIELHAGEWVTVTGNTLDDVLIGISLNPYNDTDTLADVTVTGNVYSGTSTSGAASTTGNYGIFVGGGEGVYTPSDVAIVGNMVGNANAVVRGASQGGIGIGVGDRITVLGNSIRSTYGSGIVINNAPVSAVVVTDNFITDILQSGIPAPNERYGILVSTSGNVGRIVGNEIVGVDYGIGFDAPNPAMILEGNRIRDWESGPYRTP